MLRVNVLTENKLIKEFNILGHANYAEYGMDVVCAAVSSIVTTTVNAVLMFNKNYIVYENKDDRFHIKVNENNEVTNNLFFNMLNMLKELMDDYPDNIKIKEENS